MVAENLNVNAQARQGSALPATDEDDTGRRGDVMDATWAKQLSTQLHVLQEVRAASNGLQRGFKGLRGA